MKKKKFGFIAGIACAAICTAGIFPGITGAEANGQNPELSWGGEEVSSAYCYGSTFTVPRRTLGGSDEGVNYCLILPDGSATYSDSVALTQGGNYKLIYTAKIGGKTYTESHSFSVGNVLYSVSSQSSSVEYVRELSNVRTPKGGVMVSLAEKDVLIFNDAISVDRLTKADSFIEGFVYPATVGTSDFSQLNFTLTDMENPDIYLKITINERIAADTTKGQAYISAGGNGQDMVGVEVPSGQEIGQPGEKIFTNDGYGNTIYMPFNGLCTSPVKAGVVYTFEPYADDYPFRLSYEAETMRVWNTGNYVLPPKFEGSDEYNTAADKSQATVTNSNVVSFVSDLDDGKYYKTLWEGFKSGYVRLSVQAGKYSSTTANFAVTKVAGMELSENSFTVKSAPIVTVSDERESMPEAKVGHGYPVGSATAFDIYYGNLDVQTNVWYNYNGANSVSVKMQGDRFYPVRPGYYAIVYSATNGAGISSEKVVWVHASDTVSAVSIDFKDGKTTAAKAGEWVSYADATIGGGSGEALLKRVYAEHESGEILETEGGFRPDKIGKWKVVYEAEDYIGQQTKAEYEVTVTENEKPVLTESVILPKVFIAGGKYVLPAAYGKIYSANGVASELCSVKIVDGSGEKDYRDGDTYVPQVSGNGDTISVIYSCRGTEIYREEIICVTPYEGTILDYGTYFVTSDATGEKSEDGYLLTTNGQELSFLYANPVIAQNASVGLLIPVTSNYRKLVIRLTDCGDYGNEIEAVLEDKDGRVCFTVGDESYKTAYAFSRNAFSVTVSYASGTFALDGVSLAVKTNAAGKAFAGFASDKVYISVTAVGVQEGAQLGVTAIRGYLFGVQTADRVKPQIEKYADLDQGHIGEEYVIPAISAGDVICPSLKSSLTVTAPDGTVVKDKNGVELKDCDPFVDHIIEITMLGVYKVVYTVVEDHAWEGVRAFDSPLYLSISVPDTESPVISLLSDYTVKAKVGDTVVLPDYEVSDNYSGSDKIISFVQIYNPNGMIQSLAGDCNSVKVSMAGDYTVLIMAIDEAGNVSVLKITITVE